MSPSTTCSQITGIFEEMKLNDTDLMVVRRITELGICQEITCDMFGLTFNEFRTAVKGITVRPGR